MKRIEKGGTTKDRAGVPTPAYALWRRGGKLIGELAQTCPDEFMNAPEGRMTDDFTKDPFLFASFRFSQPCRFMSNSLVTDSGYEHTRAKLLARTVAR